MFKALNLETKQEIIILAPHWRDQLKHLRRLDRADELVCPVCEQPVRVRAGRKVRWHFAHKHLRNCAMGYASPELLAARATLYAWLVDQFGERNVTLELAPEGFNLPRPMDARVTAGERRLAYWIFDTRLKPAAREDLVQAFEDGELSINWLFSAKMLRLVEEQLDCIYLTTTERDFRQSSDYDLIGARDLSRPGASLHYLDAERANLHTYRGLKLVHPPQLFRGRALSSPLEIVSADPQSGAFVHPGEATALEEVRSAQMARKALFAQARAAFHQRRTHPESPSIDPVRRSPEEETKSTVKLENTALPEHLEVPPAHQFGKVEAACLFCGQITTDWWYIDRKSGRCKCRECLDKGIA